MAARMDGQINRWMDEGKDEQIAELIMDGLMMYRWREEWMDGWLVDEYI